MATAGRALFAERVPAGALLGATVDGALLGEVASLADGALLGEVASLGDGTVLAEEALLGEVASLGYGTVLAGRALLTEGAAFTEGTSLGVGTGATVLAEGTVFVETAEAITPYCSRPFCLPEEIAATHKDATNKEG